MKPHQLQPHQPRLTLIAGGPCRCLDCRHARFEVKVLTGLVAFFAALAGFAWVVAGRWP